MLAVLCLVQIGQAPTMTQVWRNRLQTEVQSFVVGERAIFFGTNDSFGALDQSNGKKIWAKSVAQPQLGVFVAEGEGVLFASVGQGDLWAYDATTGKLKWKASRSGYASPIGSYNQAVYAEIKPGTLTALSAANGKPLWTAPLDKATPSTKPIRFGKSIFAGTKTGSVFAFDKDSGQEVWRFKERNSSVQALLVVDERLVATFDDGAILGLSLETGQRLWAVYTNNALFGTPLVKDGRIFATSASGRFYSIAAQSGQEIWQRSLSFRQNFGLSQPMPFRDGFLLADKSKLVHLNFDGEKQWEADVKEDLFGQQPRPLGNDFLLTTSHGFMRYRFADSKSLD
jgi:outer membrane protein assembly factor BamB